MHLHITHTGRKRSHIVICTLLCLWIIYGIWPISEFSHIFFFFGSMYTEDFCQQALQWWFWHSCCLLQLNFVKLACLSGEFSVMIMEENRSVHSLDSLHWLPSAPCNLCSDRLKVRHFALDKSALFSEFDVFRGLISQKKGSCVLQLIMWSFLEYWEESIQRP